MGSPNFTAGRSFGAPIAIVVHTMAGTLAGSDSWFQQTGHPVSSTYGVGLKGDIHQYVKLEDTHYANGVLQPGNKWAPRFGTQWPNARTVSIETEDTAPGGVLGAAPVSDAEYAGTLAACRVTLARYPNIVVLTGHHVIDPINRPHCPGPRWIASGRLKALAQELDLELFI